MRVWDWSLLISLRTCSKCGVRALCYYASCSPWEKCKFPIDEKYTLMEVCAKPNWQGELQTSTKYFLMWGSV